MSSLARQTICSAGGGAVASAKADILAQRVAQLASPPGFSTTARAQTRSQAASRESSVLQMGPESRELTGPSLASRNLGDAAQGRRMRKVSKTSSRSPGISGAFARPTCWRTRAPRVARTPTRTLSAVASWTGTTKQASLVRRSPNMALGSSQAPPVRMSWRTTSKNSEAVLLNKSMRSTRAVNRGPRTSGAGTRGESASAVDGRA
mmetsp:Transcript_27550/g.80436  ORF Transcript_27550/g.80436 Transcript_27550/m.80436 type:complete len:206 (+) Transcript_27550:3448-4065(+)